MTYTAQPMAHHGFKPLSARRAAAAAVLRLTATAMANMATPSRGAPDRMRLNNAGWSGANSITPPSKAPSGSL